MAATYYAQILARFDWARIVRSFDGVEHDVRLLAEAEAVHPDWSSLHWKLGLEVGWQHDLVRAFKDPDGEGWQATYYVGSVMNLFPSGRYTAPWSEVSDEDARFAAAWDKALDKFGLFTLSGEGDPTDVLVARTFEL